MITKARIENVLLSAAGGVIGWWTTSFMKHLYYLVVNHVRVVIR